MKKWEVLLCILLFIGAFAVRLYKFHSPLADWHSWRQVDTSAVSRSFVDKGFDLLHPTFEDISNVPSGLDNPKGYRFVEFPIYNALQAGGYKIFPKIPLEQWGRLITIFSSLISLLFVFLLARKYIGRVGAFFAAGFFAFDPYNIYYSRVVLPDPSMVTATLGCIYFFDKFVENKQSGKAWMVWFCLAVCLGAIALLLKPYAAFFFLPMLFIAWKKWGWHFLFKPLLWGALVISFLPLLLWRVWMLQYPAGIPASSWLFNGGNIRFTGAFFYWIFANRFRIILGLWGLPLFFFGFLSKRKGALLFFFFLLSSLIYVTVIARGNVQHDYYQILVVPSFAFMVGLGVDFLLSLPKEYGGKLGAYILIFLCSIGIVAFGWYYVRNNYNVNTVAVDTGQAVDRLTPKNAKILTFQDGDTTLLYYTHRQGWASLEKSLPQMIAMGADYMAITNPTPSDINGFGKEYAVVAQTSEYLILNLRQPIKQ